MKEFIGHLLRPDVDIYFCGHRAAHAANAYYSSGFDAALTVTLDAFESTMRWSTVAGRSPRRRRPPYSADQRKCVRLRRSTLRTAAPRDGYLIWIRLGAHDRIHPRSRRGRRGHGHGDGRPWRFETVSRGLLRTVDLAADTGKAAGIQSEGRPDVVYLPIPRPTRGLIRIASISPRRAGGD